MTRTMQFTQVERTVIDPAWLETAAGCVKAETLLRQERHFLNQQWQQITRGGLRKLLPQEQEQAEGMAARLAEIAATIEDIARRRLGMSNARNEPYEKVFMVCAKRRLTPEEYETIHEDTRQEIASMTERRAVAGSALGVRGSIATPRERA